MSRISSRLVLSASAALLASAVAAPAALAASPTNVKIVDNTLVITAGAGTTNVISVANEGSPGNYRLRDLGDGATFVNGGGINAVMYSPNNWVVTGSTAITSVRVKSGDQADVINTVNLTLPASLLGGSGNDMLFAGPGRTTLSGSTGNDTVEGGANADVLIGGSGTDRIKGFGGDDLIFANDASADTVDGGTGDDEVATGGGDSLAGVESIIFGD